jgi:lipoprotein-anchoring transpeptidase ErfK/SrfK
MRRLAVLAALALGATGCGGDGERDRSVATGPPATGPRTAEERPSRPATDGAGRALPAEGPLRRLGGRVLRRTQLRASPGGRVVRTIGRRTRMRGPQILAIVARRGAWFGVLHEAMPNGRAGWIPVDAVRVVREPWEIVVDRSSHRLTLLRGGRVVDRFSVATGRPGSPTPVGRFAVTDRLTAPAGSPYGCCILALSGRQTRLPPGWSGGDRLALHGTTDGVVGGGYSSGCVRIREPDLRRLMRRIPVGTRVTVRP